LISRWWNGRKITNLIGLDIGSDSLKLLKINTAITPHVIEMIAVTPLPAGALVKEEIKDASAIGNVLRELLKQQGVLIKQVALAIPRSAVIIKNTTIDNRLSSTEIDSRAWIEANRHFPDLVGEIYLDYHIVGPSQQDPAQLDFVLVACRKEQIKPYLDVMRYAGVVPKVVDVNCYALERALNLLKPQLPAVETSALLNLDFSLSTLIVTQGPNLLYAHDHSYDGRRLTIQVRDYLGSKDNMIIDAPEKKGTIEDIMYVEILKESLSAHLRHSMHFFYSSRPNIAIQQMVISGDLAIIPDVALFVQKETGIDAIVASPFAGMNVAPGVDENELRRYGPTLMLSCGLALSALK
jgi:type IV pilus assembly protein PilM